MKKKLIAVILAAALAGNACRMQRGAVQRLCDGKAV